MTSRLKAIVAVFATVALISGLTGCAMDDENDDERLEQVTRVEGRMTDEGVTCPAMRSDDDTLYTLIGHDDLDDLEPGDRIHVEGTEPEMSICQQGITLEVTRLERR